MNDDIGTRMKEHYEHPESPSTSKPVLPTVSRPTTYPPVRPATILTLTTLAGSLVIRAAEIERLRDVLERFAADIEPWRSYAPSIDRRDTDTRCRCGATTQQPARDGWRWRRLRKPYATSRSGADGLCPACRAAHGIP